MSMVTAKSLSEFSREDTFDSREAQDRIKWLEVDPDEEEQEELKAWEAIREEAEGYSGDNWRDGITFIRDSFFERYAEEFADEIGAVDAAASWPTSHIDWKAAADELKQDYTSIEIDGIEFWYR